MGVTVADKTTNNESKKNSERIKHIFYTFFTCGLGKMIMVGESRGERGNSYLPLFSPPPLLSSLSHNEKEPPCRWSGPRLSGVFVWLLPEDRWRYRDHVDGTVRDFTCMCSAFSLGRSVCFFKGSGIFFFSWWIYRLTVGI